MAIMDLNPYRAGTPVAMPNVSMADVVALSSSANNSLQNALQQLTGIGQNIRSGNVQDLIASGKLSGMNEADARALIAGTAGGSVTPAMQTELTQLLGGIREADKSKATAETSRAKSNADLVKMQLEKNIEQANALGLKDVEHQNQMALEQLKGSQNLELEKLKQANKDGSMDKLLSKSVAENITKDSNFVDTQVKKVEALFDEDNLIFDAELGKSAKAEVRNAIRKAVESPEGVRLLAFGDKNSIYELVNKNLPKGMSLEEGFFGGISLKKK